MQPIQHVDQTWSTSGLKVKVLCGEREIRNVYLAPDGEALPLEKEGEYASINLPPIGTHAVVVLEWAVRAPRRRGGPMWRTVTAE